RCGPCCSVARPSGMTTTLESVSLFSASGHVRSPRTTPDGAGSAGATGRASRGAWAPTSPVTTTAAASPANACRIIPSPGIQTSAFAVWLRLGGFGGTSPLRPAGFAGRLRSPSAWWTERDCTLSVRHGGLERRALPRGLGPAAGVGAPHARAAAARGARTCARPRLRHRTYYGGDRRARSARRRGRSRPLRVHAADRLGVAARAFATHPTGHGRRGAAAVQPCLRRRVQRRDLPLDCRSRGALPVDPDGASPRRRLVAQCGGAGNLAQLMGRVSRLMEERRFVPFFSEWTELTYYADVDSTKRRLIGAGFTDVEVWLEAAPTTFDSPDAYQQFIATVCVRNHLTCLSLDERRAFLRELTVASVRDQPAFTLDYWRLNITARRPA